MLHQEKKGKEIILPADFDGTFKFTNFTDEEFTTKWDNISYTFPAKSTIPLIIVNATPLEIQNIRKKFARDLATIEWYKSEKFKMMDAHVPGGTPALYTEADLKPFVQRCLEPLPKASATMIQNERSEIILSQDTKVITNAKVDDNGRVSGDSLTSHGVAFEG